MRIKPEGWLTMADRRRIKDVRVLHVAVPSDIFRCIEGVIAVYPYILRTRSEFLYIAIMQLLGELGCFDYLIDDKSIQRIDFADSDSKEPPRRDDSGI